MERRLWSHRRSGRLKITRPVLNQTKPTPSFVIGNELICYCWKSSDLIDTFRGDSMAGAQTRGGGGYSCNMVNGGARL